MTKVRSMRQTTSMLATFGTALALLSCGGDGSTDPGGGNGGGGNGGGGGDGGDGGGGAAVVVNMQNTAFVAPGGGDDVTVEVGTPVTWENLDAVQHTVRSSDEPQGGVEINSGSFPPYVTTDPLNRNDDQQDTDGDFTVTGIQLSERGQLLGHDCG